MLPFPLHVSAVSTVGLGTVLRLERGAGGGQRDGNG